LDPRRPHVERWVDDEIIAFDWRLRTIAQVATQALGQVDAAAESTDRSSVVFVRRVRLPAGGRQSTAAEFQRMATAAMRDGLPYVLELRRTADGAVIGSADIRLGGTHRDVARHPNGRAIACVTKDGVSAFSVPDLAPIAAIPLAYPSAARFSPSGEWLAAGGWEEGVCVRWEALLERGAG
jgi:hypothetical protein